MCSNNCQECFKRANLPGETHQQKYYRLNKTTIIAAQKAKYQENKEEKRAYYQANKEAKQAYYQANKEKISKRYQDAKAKKLQEKMDEHNRLNAIHYQLERLGGQ
jgi:hypothetical protein